MCPLLALVLIGFFFAVAISGTNEVTRQAVRSVKQSVVYLDVYALGKLYDNNFRSIIIINF